MKKTIETSIEIEAASEKVWSILSKTSDYETWNPFVRSIQGSLVRGKKIGVLLNPPGGGTFKFKPVVLNDDFPEIRWKGKFLVKGLFDGEHYFRLEAISSTSTRFIHGEHFSGILIGLMGGILEKTKNGFELMNRALKDKAEQ
ncbi:MAG: SRPBCC family protein [Bdellovibrionota bacterium]